MRFSLEDKYQATLIATAVLSTVLFGVFIYKELFPEYKEYQNQYVEMEQWRAEQSGEAMAPFKGGIKQIVISKEDKGPETIDRCVSCHVAMKLPHFSSVKVATDINGKAIVDGDGAPVKVPNEEYVWAKIDARIAELRDEQVLAKLEESGDSRAIQQRLAEAENLESWKVQDIHGQTVDMTRILAAHPLIGNETYPFEYHAMEDYGCTSCHSGNGRGLVFDKAHGPVFDGQYEREHAPAKPDFLETDPDNDPAFARVFNDKPGHHLLFQTTPVLVGKLMQASCVQCHQSTSEQLQKAVDTVGVVKNRKEQQLTAIKEGISDDQQALLALLDVKDQILRNGLTKTLKQLRKKSKDFTRDTSELDQISGRLDFLMTVRASVSDSSGQVNDENWKEAAISKLNHDIVEIVGSEEQARQLEAIFDGGSLDSADEIVATLDKQGLKSGSLYDKKLAYDYYKQSLRRVDNATAPLAQVREDSEIVQAMGSSADYQTKAYTRGQQLFMSNACYACHRISGYSRGGVGPELTQAGLLYPWYIKESIVWPQSNLKSSTMPNFRMDHEEIEDLVTYLMAQRGDNQAVSQVDKKVTLRAWDAGEKMAWEKPVSASEIRDIQSSMLVFANEGCASCHRLKGFESEVGFVLEKSKPSFDKLWRERRWFREIFPEGAIGSQIVASIDRHGEEIDRRIQHGVHDKAVLEAINEQISDGVASFYSNFKFARRAKDKSFNDRLANAANDEERQKIEAERELYLDRVNRVLMAFAQEYGLGREIGPRLHWAGIYRDTEWLVQHFRNPAAHSAKSLMPVFPYDDTKFYALTYMLQELAKKNRDETRQIWETEGFNPETAYEMHCASCHGEVMHGDGPIATWIYPIPKNLRNGTFLRNLTRERIVQSLMHGVKGGPMPPWGESAEGMGQAVLNKGEIDLLTNWLFLSLGGEGTFQEEDEVLKWRYEPSDFLKELRDEGGSEELDLGFNDDPLGFLYKGEDLWVSLKPRIAVDDSGIAIEQVFDVQPLSQDDVEDYGYYIKKKFYTAANLEEGQRLFIANCAHCHGKEGAGNGDRAATMEEAKPRMLTNLPWLRTKDDLQLLRSLKYGVAGTPMTPWGDKTSALQRMQMVVFIRQLTAERAQRENLASVLFHAFERAILAINDARVKQGNRVAEIQTKYSQAKLNRELLYGDVQSDKVSPEAAAKAYAEELALMNSLRKAEELEFGLQKLATEVLSEKELYESLGIALINSRIDDESMNRYLDLVSRNTERYKEDDGRLLMQISVHSENALATIGQELLSHFKSKESQFLQRKEVILGQLPSAERTEHLEDLSEKITGLDSLQRKLISALAEAERSRERQRELYQTVSEKLREVQALIDWDKRVPTAA